MSQTKIIRISRQTRLNWLIDTAVAAEDAPEADASDEAAS